MKIIPLKIKHLIFYLSIFVLSISCENTVKYREEKSNENIKAMINKVLNTKNQYNIIENKVQIISDAKTAVAIAEPILFGLFGEMNILKQRPYYVFYEDHYYVIEGDMPKNRLGGTFSIVMDANHAQVISITI